jgi:hypothetical protein
MLHSSERGMAKSPRWWPGRIQCVEVREWFVQCNCGNEEIVAEPGLIYLKQQAEHSFTQRVGVHEWQKIRGAWRCPGCVRELESEGKNEE